MGLFSYFKRSAPPTKQTYFYSTSGSGLNLSERSLLENPTVISCVNIISRSISMLPLNLYVKSKTGRQRAGWHKLFPVLRYSPNGEEPSSVFIEKILRDMLMHGNAFIWKSHNGMSIDSLYTLSAKDVKVSRDPITNAKRFEYNDKIYTSKDILHIPGAFYDGTKGYSPANYASKAIEMGVSLDDYARTAFDNGPNTRLIVDISEQFPGAKPDDVKAMADYIARNYSGKENAGKPLITFNKMKATPVQVSSNKDAELVEARSYQQRVIAQMFQVPLFLLGEGSVTYGNYEASMTGFLTFTLGPWIKRLEQYFSMLLTPADQVNMYIEFDPSYLLRTDLASKTASYATLHRIGVLSTNEIRERENLGELEDSVAGTTHFIEANLMPLNRETISAYMAGQKLKLQEVNGEPKLDKKIL